MTLTVLEVPGMSVATTEWLTNIMHSWYNNTDKQLLLHVLINITIITEYKNVTVPYSQSAQWCCTSPVSSIKRYTFK